MLNTYHEELQRIASAMEAMGGFRDALKGQRFDLASDDGVRAALCAVVRLLGGEVENA